MINDVIRKDNESYIAFAKRITNGKADGTLDIDYVEWGNALISKEYSSDNLRKAFYFMQLFLERTDEEDYKNFTEDDLIREIEDKKIELQKERYKYQDYRNAYNKLIRQRSRQEELNEIIIDTIKNSDLPKLNYVKKEFTPSDNDLMISINDVHYGIEIDNYWNKYNSDICRDMFEEYLDKILQVKKIHNSQNCFICANGDLISGMNHLVVSLENRENIIKQIMGVSELIANFVYELSQNFENVYFASVAGNHSRLTTNKNDAMKDERLDILVEFYLKARLQQLKNVHFKAENIDTTITLVTARGRNYGCVHGDYEENNTKLLSLITMIDKPLYAILLGHKHRNKSDSIQNVKIVMAGSFQSTDSYCVQQRIVGRPQQLICVCDEDGIMCMYDVDFKKNWN
jgi:predicted phosphodiesterase